MHIESAVILVLVMQVVLGMTVGVVMFFNVVVIIFLYTLLGTSHAR